MKLSTKSSTQAKCHDLGHSTDTCNNTRTTDERRLIDDQKLSLPEAAKVIGISSNSLRRVIEQGRLPVLRILTKTLILESDVEQFLRESRMSVRRVENTRTSLPPLPASVINSKYLKV